MRRPLDDDLRIRDWLDFIEDKSLAREAIDPGIDRLLDELGVKFWVTREYKPAGQQWNTEEVAEGLNRTYRLILQHDYDLPSDFVQRIRLMPTVEDARELTVGHVELPQVARAAQMSVERRRPSELINLAYARAMSGGSPEIRIAVLDTGVNLDHPELQGSLVTGADFVDFTGLDTTGFIGDMFGYLDDPPEDHVGHGTHVSGIIASRGLQMDEGVCYGCSIMPVRVLATLQNGKRLIGAGIPDNIGAGIKWAVDNGASVLNLSLGIKATGGGLPHADVIRYALSKEVTVVAASGNDGTPERYYPGALPGVIAVGAVDDGGIVTPFTSYGANIAVVAPGMNIYSSFAHHTYAFASGTSQASPFVAGAIGLMKSYAMEQGKKLTNHDIAHVLKHTSDKIDGRLRNERAGYGLINLADAFKFLAYELG